MSPRSHAAAGGAKEPVTVELGAHSSEKMPGGKMQVDLELKSFDGREVDVRGWPKLPDKDDQKAWIGRVSDHALLYFEVQRVS